MEHPVPTKRSAIVAAFSVLACDFPVIGDDEIRVRLRDDL